jgi:hypothetical protein
MTAEAMSPLDPQLAPAGGTASDAVAADLDEEMTRLNLMRALRDTEVATQRVQDLTARLVSLAEENKQLTIALAGARADVAAL